MSYANSLASDPDAYLCSLIRELPCPLFCKIMGYIDLSVDSVALRSDCMYTQDNLELHFPHMAYDKCSLWQKKTSNRELLQTQHLFLFIYKYCIWTEVNMWQVFILHCWTYELHLVKRVLVTCDLSTQSDLRATLSADRSMRPYFVDKWIV